MKYLQKFLKHSDYIAWLNSEDYVTPSVAICLEEGHTHYHPYVPPTPPTEEGIVTCVYEVSSDGRYKLYGYQNIQPSTSASYGLNNFSEMRIDGGEWVPAENYAYLTEGNHTIEFKLIDDTLIERGTFDETIDGLKEVTVPDTVTQIIYDAFHNSYLESVTLNSVTPPELIVWHREGNGEWFGNTGSINYPIHVPSGSVNAYKTAENWSTFYATRIV